MAEPKLSICIPTYNRSLFLTKALNYFINLYRFPFSYEIVISDNASTDNTREVVDSFIAQGLPIRYFRRSENPGYEPNLASAFRHARGEYAVYLADDDVLVNDGLAEAVHYMDNNSDAVAVYAPWYLHDEVNSCDQGIFYTVDANLKFRQSNFTGLFSFIVERNIFPEIGIYRTGALRSAWVPRHFAYWAFAHLAHYIDQGAVAFLKKPFYRAVTASTIQRDRPQAGNEEVMTAWDKYRGGLEYFLYIGARRGFIDMTPQRRTVYEGMIKNFTLSRMAVATRFWVERKDYLKAYELYTRLLLGGQHNNGDVLKLKESLKLMAAVQTLVWQINAAAEVKWLILYGVTDHEALAGLLRDVGLSPEVAVIEDNSDYTPEQIERTAVFATATSDRVKFLSRGYPPNLVFSEEDVMRSIIV